MKMRNEQKRPAIILANVEVFDYLKEKVGERKTRTEAYCDLLDKSLAGFTAPFLRKQDYDLRPGQCHVTISDLAAEWRWHRATVRSFLDAMEALGQLKRIKLPKSVVITMSVESGHTDKPHIVQETPELAMQLNEVLSDWIIGRATSAEVGTTCGQFVSRAISETDIQDNLFRQGDSHIGLDRASQNNDKQMVEIRSKALGCIALAVMQKELRKSRFDASLDLMDFFRLDLGEDWEAFIEASGDLARLILDAEPGKGCEAMDEDQKLLKTLVKPFLSLAAKAQEEQRNGGE